MRLEPPPLPSEATSEDLRSRLKRLGPVMLYGAGSVGRDVLAILQADGLIVRGFLDAKDLSLAAINGVAVHKPDAPSFGAEERRTIPVIVTIFNAYVDMPAIHENLARLGWENVVVFTEFYEAYAAELGNRYWITKRDYYRHHGSQLQATRDLWADEKSRVLFDSLLKFRLTGDYTVLAAPDHDSQYFPPDVPAWARPLRMIDCGAYDGDTLRQVRALGLPMEAYAALEPDPGNFTKLAQETARSATTSPALVALWPCGAWSHACQLRFSSGQGSGSAVNPNGQTLIQCVALDEALPAFGPTLIKMDIEGAEFPALLGAAHTIRAHRPGLAICLYHEPAHLWQIPLLIAGWNLGYRCYLRCHCHNGFELVLYAVAT